MSIKKLIAYITVAALLALSFNVTAIASPTKPVAVIGDTVCNGAVLTGNYEYTGSNPQGKSIFRWYMSDSFFDKGELVKGADKQTFNVNNSTNGKFITFAVVPVDINGVQGDEVCADPVMQNQGTYEYFDSVLPDKLSSTVTSGGYVKLVSNPDGDGDVLGINKSATASRKTEARLYFDRVTSSKSVVEAKVYVSGISGMTRFFGIYDDAYGSVIELLTDGSGKLYYRGGDGQKDSGYSFDADCWNRIVVDINGEDKTVDIIINENEIVTGEPWRFENDGYNNVASYFLNYGNGGTVYISDISVMNLMGGESAAADMALVEENMVDETIDNLSLPDKGENGSAIYWKSSLPEYITTDGVVTRPAYGEGDAEVVLTAYVINGSAVVKKDFMVVVPESTLPPEAQDIKIVQNGARPVVATYTYYDEEMEAERGTVIQWYVEGEDGEYEAIEDANELIFTPDKSYDGKNIKICITPKNAANVVGIKTFSEPLKYVYYETQKPVAAITSKSINGEGKFEFEYSYVSPDYIKEGATKIQWLKSDSLFGEYTPVSGAAGLTYKPADTDAYYKFSLTPVDADGNEGEAVVEGPFMYAEPGTSSANVADSAISALVLPEETCVDIELPLTTEAGAYYTWVSSDNSVMSVDGKITRPAVEDGDAPITLTVHAACGFDIKTAEYNIVVKKYSNAPVASDYSLSQTSRPIELGYTYTDADGDEEGETIFEWYAKPDADSEFSLIEGANESRYAPSKDMDGYIFVAKITPCDANFTYGEQVTTAEYVYEFKSPAIPSAECGAVEYGLTSLTGNYTYINTDGIPEGNSEYRWYVANKLLGEYELIEDANELSYSYPTELDGKYVKFEVVPKDVEGVTGEAYSSNPVLIRFSAPDTFDAGYNIAQTIDTSNLFGGTVKVVTDPADPNNTALRLQRTSTAANEISRIGYMLPKASGATGVIIEADLYASSDLNGIWEMFYLCNANVSQAYKLWINGTSLYSRGGSYTKPDGTVVSDSSMKISSGFIRDKWHHVKIVMDTANQMMRECYFNGELVQTDMPFRFSVPAIEGIFSYIQNNYKGTAYIDNIAVTPIYDYTGLAKEDASAIDLGADLDAVISNLRLPTSGSVNGSAITWASSDETVISARGKVNRPASAEGDRTVTLTAYVVNGNDYEEREFTVNVMRILTDEEIVSYDAEKLSSYNNIIIDKDIKLPSDGVFGASYKWVSSDESAISNTGKVTQGTEKKTVTFEVTISEGDYNAKEQVTMYVAPATGDNLVINGGIDASSAKAQYPASNAGDGDYSTSWSSLPVDTAPSMILDMGKTKDVNKLYIADATKSISSVKVSYSRDKVQWSDVNIISGFADDVINIIVFDKVSARYIRVNYVSEGTVSADEIRLMFDATDSDKVAGGINDITLPVENTVSDDFKVVTELADGTKVEWKSSNEDVLYFVGNKAIVKPASSDKSVTVTATVISGGVSAEKIFSLIVEGTGSSSGGGGGGGSSSGGRGSGGVSSAMGVGAPVVAPTTVPGASAEFVDIAGVPWAVEAINKLASIGVVNGTSAKTFEPDRSITREEFAAILYRGFGFDKVEATGSFSDVKDSDWYYEAVMQFSALGIINGVGDGSFGTGRTITRQDMAVMIYRAAIAANAQFTSGGTSFADEDSIAEYAKAAVEALSGAKIVNGVGGGNFAPHGNATRAEATVILSRIMDYIK